MYTVRRVSALDNQNIVAVLQILELSTVGKTRHVLGDGMRLRVSVSLTGTAKRCL
jgi:hypothetical protein